MYLDITAQFEDGADIKYHALLAVLCACYASVYVLYVFEVYYEYQYKFDTNKLKRYFNFNQTQQSLAEIKVMYILKGMFDSCL